MASVARREGSQRRSKAEDGELKTEPRTDPTPPSRKLLREEDAEREISVITRAERTSGDDTGKQPIRARRIKYRDHSPSIRRGLKGCCAQVKVCVCVCLGWKQDVFMLQVVSESLTNSPDTGKNYCTVRRSSFAPPPV